jgi:hypothetical protein
VSVTAPGLVGSLEGGQLAVSEPMLGGPCSRLVWQVTGEAHHEVCCTLSLSMHVDMLPVSFAMLLCSCVLSTLV